MTSTKPGSTQTFSTETTAPAPVFSGIPPAPLAYAGREELMQSVIDSLLAGHNVALTSSGVPGIGLTTLAAAVAHSPVVRERFNGGLLWATLGQQPDISTILARWETDLGINSAVVGDETERAREVTAEIGARRMLIVIDDAWHIADARMLQCGGLNCAFLLTSNYRAVAREFAEPEQARIVRELTPSAAFELLQTLAPDACAAEPDLALQASHAAGGLPLTIKLLAGYLTAKTPGVSASSALNPQAVAAATARVPHARLTIALGRLGTHDHTNTTLQQAIALSLTGLPAQALRAFYALGSFVPSPATFTREAAIAITQTDATTIDQLIARNLIDLAPGEPDALSVHPVIAGVARARRDPKTDARHRAFYLADLQKRREDIGRLEVIYPQVEHAWAGSPDEPLLLEFAWTARLYQIKRGMDRTIKSWIWRCKNMPHVASASAPNTASDDRAIELMEAVNRTLDLAEHIEIATGETAVSSLGAVLFNIGSAYDSLGRREQALEYYSRAWPLQEKCGDQAGLAITLNNIGSIYYEMQLPGKALDYLRISVACRERIKDDSSAQFGQTLNNLGVVYTNLGLARDAAKHFRRSLDIHIKLGDHAGEAVTRTNLAKFHHLRGPLKDAVTHMTRVVELDKLLASPELNRHQTKLAKLKIELDDEIARGGVPISMDTAPGSMISSTPGNLYVLKAPQAPRKSFHKTIARALGAKE
ncbi:MAG TPA: NB-ARC domain-containing protein [Anaerolineae bacterium]